ncbi:MAG: CotH kinase family protein [Comamonas sp.]|nr:CotH kinase family protein [Comamonas sp.]
MNRSALLRLHYVLPWLLGLGALLLAGWLLRTPVAQSPAAALGAAPTPASTDWAQGKPLPEQCRIHPIAHLALHTSSEQPLPSRQRSAKARLHLSYPDSAQAQTMKLTWRVRGNHTATLPKQPYKLTLKRPLALLDMPAERQWLLLANYEDGSHLRNALAMCLGSLLELPYVPRYRFVTLSINGQPQGLYNLFEDTNISPQRLAIASNHSPSWLLEMNYRQDKHPQLRSSAGVPYAIAHRSPTAEPAAALAALETALRQCAQGQCSANLNAHLQVEHFLRYLWVQDWLKNVDAFLASTFVWQQGQAALEFGPLWDFDIAAGNFAGLDAPNPQGWYTLSAAYPLADNPQQLPAPSLYPASLLQDPQIQQRYLALIAHSQVQLWPILQNFLHQASAQLAAPALADHALWHQQHQPPRPLPAQSAAELEHWLAQRLHWASAQSLESLQAAINAPSFTAAPPTSP